MLQYAKTQLTGPHFLMLGKRAGGGEGDRGWDSCMASLTQRTWVWANSGRQWRTRKPGMLQSMRSQRISHNLATEQQFFLVTSLGSLWCCCHVQMVLQAETRGSGFICYIFSYFWSRPTTTCPPQRLLFNKPCIVLYVYPIRQKGFKGTNRHCPITWGIWIITTEIIQ